MRKTFGVLASTVLVATGLATFVAAPAQAADCRLIQTDIYNGANILAYAQGLEGCSGDVYSELQGTWSADGSGPWTVYESGTIHYDNEYSSYYPLGECLPNYVRVYAKFGDQEKLTRPAINNNAGTC